MYQTFKISICQGRLIFLLTILLSCTSVRGQQGISFSFEHSVLNKVKSAVSPDGEVEELENLFLSIKNDNSILSWLKNGRKESRKFWLLAQSVPAYPKINGQQQVHFKSNRAALIPDELFHLPDPTVNIEDAEVRSFADEVASILEDKKAWEESFDQTMSESGISSMFVNDNIPLEGEDATRLLFVNPDKEVVAVANNQGLIRPLYNQAMVLEKRYKNLYSLLNAVDLSCEKELYEFTKVIDGWTMPADYSSETVLEKQSQMTKEAKIYRIARGILLRICQEEISAQRSLTWKAQVKSLSDLVEQTAQIYASVNWDAPACKKSNLNNPLIQLAQRSKVLSLRYDLIIFNGTLVQNEFKMVYKNFSNITNGYP